MPDEYDELADRVATLERALSDGAGSEDHPSDPPADVEDRLATVESDLADLEAAVQAVRGYVGQVRHVNREVERTAETALAVAERRAEGDSADLLAPNGDPLDALAGAGSLDDAVDGPPDGSLVPPPASEPHPGPDAAGSDADSDTTGRNADDGDAPEDVDADTADLLARVRGAL